MPSYEEIKSEMNEIAEVLKKYPESLQEKVFKVLISKFLGDNNDLNLDADESFEEEEIIAPNILNNKDIKPKTKKQQTSTKKSPSKESFQILKDLNLRGNNGSESFVDFCKSKAPKSNIEFNVIAIYYLSRIMGIQSVTIDHIYTCYKEAGKPVPGNLKQSLFDTSSSKYGFIDTKGNNYSIPVRGENLVEHELPRSGKKSGK